MQKQGHAHVWGKSFAFGAGGSLCFSEFIALSLDEGEIYVNSPTNGTCGAQIDPALKPPLHADLGAWWCPSLSNTTGATRNCSLQCKPK